MNSRKGTFISFEGIDGSGKSTQIKRLFDSLVSNNIDAILVREPGGTQIGEKIRSILLEKDYVGMTPVTELLLYEAARAQIVAEVIIPSLSEGKTVICDRFFDSTLAYQGYARGLSLESVDFLNHLSTGGVEPDVTFLLDIEPEKAALRMRNRQAGNDRLEDEGLYFMKKVRDGYIDMTKKYDRIVIIDANASVDRVSVQIEQKVWEVLRK
ncbi:MAG TPA: dTMP kinase [Clostridiaceae bacterium]|jgi:dTMP kinase|nr:dTMP kinase [Clostridiaceae bacterium]